MNRTAREKRDEAQCENGALQRWMIGERGRNESCGEYPDYEAERQIPIIDEQMQPRVQRAAHRVAYCSRTAPRRAIARRFCVRSGSR